MVLEQMYPMAGQCAQFSGVNLSSIELNAQQMLK